MHDVLSIIDNFLISVRVSNGLYTWNDDAKSMTCEISCLVFLPPHMRSNTVFESLNLTRYSMLNVVLERDTPASNWLHNFVVLI